MLPARKRRSTVRPPEPGGMASTVPASDGAGSRFRGLVLIAEFVEVPAGGNVVFLADHPGRASVVGRVRANGLQATTAQPGTPCLSRAYTTTPVAAAAPVPHISRTGQCRQPPLMLSESASPTCC